LKSNKVPSPGNCYSFHPSQNNSEWSNAMSYCRKLSLVWAFGGPLVQDFPEDMGYPLGGGEDEFKYFILEIHYDNPMQIKSQLFFIFQSEILLFSYFNAL
jgi:hypothetical protein